MVLNRRSFVDILVRGGSAVVVLALGAAHLARGLVCRRVRYAQTDSIYPGRRKDLHPDEICKPSHWLG